MSGGLTLTFYGVRGSTPCTGAEFARYGGHSSCVVLDSPGQAPILFDLGTGLRPYGMTYQGIFHGTALLSHLHWDHMQGLPFFVPLHQPGATLDVYGPRQAEGPLGDVFAQMMRPPFFPIRPTDLLGEVRFHDTADDDFPVGLAKVRSRWIRHVGPTLGFRVEWNGVSIAYLPDHGPGTVIGDADDFVPAEVLELCDGVDVLIHDAQHTRAEYEPKRHWGHCTVDYAVRVGREAGARSLVLFHHCPTHSDDDLDHILTQAQDLSARTGGPEVLAATEGLRLPVSPR
ncbi:MAG TPA: MBL fold metallo-hydrolase [Acidimicrobiia bacterium]|nr:MBL fold metallo-hydrolase [Acidimicrobiia bacterium]